LTIGEQDEIRIQCLDARDPTKFSIGDSAFTFSLTDAAQYGVSQVFDLSSAGKKSGTITLSFRYVNEGQANASGATSNQIVMKQPSMTKNVNPTQMQQSNVFVNSGLQPPQS
jgi:hypothetical protein